MRAFCSLPDNNVIATRASSAKCFTSISSIHQKIGVSPYKTRWARTIPRFCIIPIRAGTVATARRAEVVVAGNEYIANWFDKFSKNVRVVPTSVDTDKFQPNMHNSFDTDRFVIGWIGTS